MVTNGQTRYYAVMTVDEAGQESDLSAETVYDTPRPEGVDELYSLFSQPSLSGYVAVEPAESCLHESVGGYRHRYAWWRVLAQCGQFDTDIQDAGYTADFTWIDYAPQMGGVRWVSRDYQVSHLYYLDG